jgi:hypothetical protein
MRKLKMIYIGLFKVISIEQAIEYQLTFYRNVSGDEINHINCRSIWVDKNYRSYRVKSLYKSV